MKMNLVFRHVLNILVFLAFILSLEGCKCSDSIFIKSNSTVYFLNRPDESERDVNCIISKKYKLQNGEELRIEKDHIFISPISVKTRLTDTENFIVRYDFVNNTDFRTEAYDGRILYFPDKNVSKIKDNRFKYYRINNPKLKVSAITISARYRFRPRDSEDIDNEQFPGTWETKFSPGLSFTYPFIEFGSMNAKGKLTTTSIDVGPVFSFGTTTLKAATTQPQYNLERNALTISGGCILNLSINNFDIGVFGGWEWATGDKGSDWIYNGAPNLGFIFGYDLVKPN